ncbi:Alcohol dehydrogenase GroES-like domain-containing protein [Cladophialophora immunda]|nr:Alcohol dehydrogenase GroES-like domain-containing protein [Cladophialophora immunda]
MGSAGLKLHELLDLPQIPARQTAAVREGSGTSAKVVLKEIDVPKPGPGEILVKINWSGLCASDNALVYDDWKDFGYCMQDAAHGIVGHEGAGVVVAIGEGSDNRWKIGDRAGIKWVYSTCGECEYCTNGSDECHCAKQKNPGFSVPGTFQEYALADSRYTTKLPDGVLDEEAGPLMCGGVTGFTACKRSGVKPGQWLVILGAGGGLGHLALQYAKAMGMRVIGIDEGDDKAALCKSLGVDAFFDFTKTKDIPAKVMELTTYGAHAVLCFAASQQAYTSAPDYVRVGGAVIVVGLPKDSSTIAGAPPIVFTGKRLRLEGNVTGTLKDVEEALDYTVRGLVHPILTKGTLADVEHYCKMLQQSKISGRAVIKVSSTSKNQALAAPPMEIATKPAYLTKKPEDRLFINGEYVPSKAGKNFDVINPATEKIAASVYEADVDDVDLAVQAAKSAFPAWTEAGALVRSGLLLKLADLMEKNADELDYLDAICMGKPIGDFCGAGFAAYLLRYFAGRSMDVLGTSSLNSPGFVNMAWRQPYGVCAAIIPWNITLITMINKIGPALLAGNTLVLKSSEKCPLSVIALGRLCQEAGIPNGVLNILSGFGQPCGEALAKHMEIRKLSFTGSQTAGRAIKRAAANSNLKKVTLELGGKSPLLIFPDADLSKAIPAAAYSILMLSGQACVASSRIYVHESLADEFVKGMKKEMTKLGQSGDTLDKSTFRGPQADKLQYDRIMGFLTTAREDGLNITLGGGPENKPGLYIQPTIITNAPEQHPVMRDEIFGPVVVINTFKDEDAVMKLANDSEYGLYASVFTKDIQRALRIAKLFEAGIVGVNCTSPSMAFDMPFGGWKASGDGREYSCFSTDAWTELKSVLIALG